MFSSNSDKRPLLENYRSSSSYQTIDSLIDEHGMYGDEDLNAKKQFEEDQQYDDEATIFLDSDNPDIVDDLEAQLPPDLQAKVKQYKCMSLQDIIAFCGKQGLSALAFAACGVEMLILQTHLAEESEETLRVCPLPNATDSVKMETIFVKNPGFIIFEIAGVTRFIVIPMTIGFVATCLQPKCNGKPLLSETGIKFLETIEKRVLSALFAFSAIQQSDIIIGGRDITNALSAGAMIPIVQLVGDEVEKRLGKSAPNWFLNFMHAIRWAGIYGLLLSSIKGLSDNIINLYNGTQEVNWDGQKTLNTALTLSLVPVSVGLFYYNQKIENKNKKINFYNATRDFLSNINITFAFFSFAMSIYMCWDQDREKPENFGKGIDGVIYLVFGLGALMLTVGLYYFTKTAELRARKTEIGMKQLVAVEADQTAEDEKVSGESDEEKLNKSDHNNSSQTSSSKSSDDQQDDAKTKISEKQDNETQAEISKEKEDKKSETQVEVIKEKEVQNDVAKIEVSQEKEDQKVVAHIEVSKEKEAELNEEKSTSLQSVFTSNQDEKSSPVSMKNSNSGDRAKSSDENNINQQEKINVIKTVIILEDETNRSVNAKILVKRGFFSYDDRSKIESNTNQQTITPSLTTTGSSNQ